MNWLISFVIRLYTRITCRIDAAELQTVPPTGPLIIISNHTGQIEAPLLYAHLQPRRLSGWAKSEAWKNPFLSWIFNTWGMIPVHRGEADMNALKAALRALQNNMIFGIAPEGTRNYTGQLRRALPGTVLVALHSGAPIIPIAHWGGENFLGNLRRFKRTDFHVRVGKPFHLSVTDKKIPAETRQEIVDQMMYRLAELLPAEYRGAYSDMSKATQNFLENL